MRFQGRQEGVPGAPAGADAVHHVQRRAAPIESVTDLDRAHDGTADGAAAGRVVSLREVLPKYGMTSSAKR